MLLASAAQISADCDASGERRTAQLTHGRPRACNCTGWASAWPGLESMLIAGLAMDAIGLARRDDSRRVRDYTNSAREVYQIDADHSAAANQCGHMRPLLWCAGVLLCTAPIAHAPAHTTVQQQWHGRSARHSNAETNTTAVTPTAIVYHAGSQHRGEAANSRPCTCSRGCPAVCVPAPGAG